MSTAFLFPGQGSQVVGMGKMLYHSFPEAKKIIDLADQIFGENLKKIYFEGPEETLRLTRYTQPSLYVVSAAILEVIRARGIQKNKNRPRK